MFAIYFNVSFVQNYFHLDAFNYETHHQKHFSAVFEIICTKRFNFE